jgi:hypothetical protein
MKMAEGSHKTELRNILKRVAEILFFRSGKKLNLLYYEAGWTDSFCHRRCMHEHPTLLEAAQCAEPQGAGWYVLAVEKGTPRQLWRPEENIVNEFRGRKRVQEEESHFSG